MPSIGLMKLLCYNTSTRFYYHTFIKKVELKLPSNYPVLMIFDDFSAQKTDGVLKQLRDNYIHTVYVPPNCTGYLQPMDISVNKTIKEF